MLEPGHSQDMTGLLSYQFSCFHLPLGDRLPSSLFSDRPEGKPGATLWFNDKGTLGSRRAPVKDTPVLGQRQRRIQNSTLLSLPWNRTWPGLGNGWTGLNFMPRPCRHADWEAGSASHHPYPVGPEDQVGLSCTGRVFNAMCITIYHKEQKHNILVHLFSCPLLYPPSAMSFP